MDPSFLFSILIFAIVTILVFLIFREVVCWYWKINERNSLLTEQNKILNMILKEMKGESNSEKDDANNGKMNSDIELSKEEKERVDAYIKYRIKPGQRVVMHKATRELKRFDSKDWGDVDQSEWVILFEK